MIPLEPLSSLQGTYNPDYIIVDKIDFCLNLGMPLSAMIYEIGFSQITQH